MVKVSRNTDSTCRKLKFTLQMYNRNTQKIKDEEIRKVIQSQVEDGLQVISLFMNESSLQF